MKRLLWPALLISAVIGCGDSSTGSGVSPECQSGSSPTCECPDGTAAALDCSDPAAPVCACDESDAVFTLPDTAAVEPDAGNGDAGTDTGDCIVLSFWPDSDGDGFGSNTGEPIRTCDPDPVGASDVRGDCDDNDPLVFPGAAELCDAVDNNCDGRTDESSAQVLQWPDEDGDGFGAAGSVPINSCERRDGYAPNDDDCDDDAADVYPRAADLCDGINNDCDLAIDEQAEFRTWWIDVDDDGFGDANADPVSACEQPDGYVDNGDDCVDDDAASNPEGTEVCDLVDNDCDGTIDEGTGLLVLYPDTDGDGWGSASAAPRLTCEPVAGMLPDASDCDDSDGDVNPDALEICDGIDNDCDNFIDLGASDTQFWFADTDNDGFGDPRARIAACSAPPRASAFDTDCNDRIATVFPGAEERCDGLDNDCDRVTDEGLTNACGSCGEPPAEVCGNLQDDDCDGQIDETDAGCFCDGRTDQPCYAGPPGSAGVGVCRGGTTDCACPGGARLCTDGVFGACEGQVLPSEELCDGLDNDCDGVTDEGLINACGTCGAPPTEVCDAIDNDCDGVVDEGLRLACGLCPGETPPAETCGDGLDNDCDGLADEACSCEGDIACFTGTAAQRGVGACTDGVVSCYAGSPSSGLCQGEVLPAFEVCDGLDNDCDGQIDISPDGCSVCGDPVAELCDGLDNNCDGFVDEGLRNACGQCLGDAIPEEDGGATLCDGLDNDCDGFIDEGLVNACGTCGESCYVDLDSPDAGDDIGEGAEIIAAADPNNPTGAQGVTLSRRSFLPPYLWAANETNNTVTRVNTDTLREEGRYWVGANPSRTAVDLDGNVWIGGRDDGRLTKILWDTATCPDRNGNGRVDTSVFGALGPLNSPSNPLADECVVYSAVPNPARTTIRGIAAAPDGTLWIGYSNGGVQPINPYTFALGPLYEAASAPIWAPDSEGVYSIQRNPDGSPRLYGAGDADDVYGLVVDSTGIMTLSTFARSVIARFDTNTRQWVGVYNGFCGSYGVAVDRTNRVWVGGWPQCSGVSMFDPATNRQYKFGFPTSATLATDALITVNTNPTVSCNTTATYCVTGLAAEPATGHIWASFFASGWTGRLIVNEANLAASQWRMIPSIRDPGTNALLGGVNTDLRGVGFDGNGFAYTLGLGSDRIWRIDPATNRRATDLPNGLPVGVGTHYTYSDFTGSTALSFTAPRAFWRYIFNTTVSVATLDGLRWSGFVPAETSAGIRVRAIAADGTPRTWIPAPLGDGTPIYHDYTTGAPTDTWDLDGLSATGARFEVEVRLTTSDSDIRPIINAVELLWQRP